MASSITRPWRDGLALVLLLFGGFLFGIGWIFGLTLLWTSPSWTRREKRLGSIVPLLELALFAVLVIFTRGSSLATASPSLFRVARAGFEPARDGL